MTSEHRVAVHSEMGTQKLGQVETKVLELLRQTFRPSS